jgi:tRNA pseudouridine32 synthase/23S rRNA pseudouridine746 synthase
MIEAAGIFPPLFFLPGRFPALASSRMKPSSKSNPADRKPPLPVRQGVAPSFVWLPPGPWPDLLSFLCERFPGIEPAVWMRRMQAGEVRSADGEVLGPQSPCRARLQVYYYREVPQETAVPGKETVLYRDQRILVADKPHFLPVAPAGRFLHETLLSRLRRATGIEDLVPVHRLDRETAGLVVFCIDPALRGRYQALFRERAVAKEYEAVAAAAPWLNFPLTRSSRIVSGLKFFTMQEAPGPANAQTRVDVIERGESFWRYRLAPVSGKTHQLRVHMLNLGLPILNDLLYPIVHPVGAENFDRPLQLLAKRLAFTDPVSGELLQFESRFALQSMATGPARQS